VASAATGLLLASRHACLAVERPGFNSGQLVCYPRRHVTCALSLAPAEWEELAALLREGARLARRVYDFDALNVGLSSGTGAHLTFQLIPRWTGDLNFLPLVSGFKAVPEKPEDAWRRYREVLA
jgi:ATP adenylyltransferase